MNETLSAQALKVIDNYLHLPFPGKNVSCPYFNNRRTNVRGALRALIGKGSVEDIMEETMIISLREKINLQNLSSEEIKKFLVEHNLGIDCSGFVYYILDTELQARGKEPLKKYIKRPWLKNPIRKLIAKMRPVENTGVSAFNSEANSVEIELKDIQLGDLIIMLNTGRNHDFHHVLIIHSVNRSPSSVVHYTHSFQFSTDGLYNHGIKKGKIEITDISKSLLEQKWTDESENNLPLQMSSETFEHTKLAKELKIKRLRALSN